MALRSVRPRPAGPLRKGVQNGFCRNGRSAGIVCEGAGVPLDLLREGIGPHPCWPAHLGAAAQGFSESHQGRAKPWFRCLSRSVTGERIRQKRQVDLHGSVRQLEEDPDGWLVSGLRRAFNLAGVTARRWTDRTHRPSRCKRRRWRDPSRGLARFAWRHRRDEKWPRRGYRLRWFPLGLGGSLAGSGADPSALREHGAQVLNACPEGVQMVSIRGRSQADQVQAGLSR